jgi:hypothetical protein
MPPMPLAPKKPATLKGKKKRRRWSLAETILVWAAIGTLLLTAILARKDTRDVIVHAARVVIAYLSPEAKLIVEKDMPLPYDLFDADQDGELCLWICNASTGNCLPNVGTQLAKEAEPVFSKTGRFVRDAVARKQRIFIVRATGEVVGFVDAPPRGSIRVHVPS